MFIRRIQKYAIKHLKNGVGRIYVQNSDCLRKSQLPENTAINVTYSKGRIEVVACENGKNKIMDTGRGALLELKNKDTGNAFAGVDRVSITFRKGKVIITLHHQDKKRLEREKEFLRTLLSGKPIRKASFFSGLGMLTYHLKVGLEKAGLRSQICFANDTSQVAMECALAANPIWKNPSHDAIAITDDLSDLDLNVLVNAHFADVSYPCVGQSQLCDPSKRDIFHPDAGTLFVKLIAALEKVNPAIILIENTPMFAKSETLRVLKSELKGYRFEQVILNAYEHGEIEPRPRVCVVAVSEGLPEMHLDQLTPEFRSHDVRPKLQDYLEPIPVDSPLWREMAHVKKKDTESHHNYKNKLYFGHETKIATLTASYAAPKAGTPMIAHPSDPNLQRQVTEREHSRIRHLPCELHSELMKVADGTHPMVSIKGSKTLVHRMCGNGVSKRVWNDVGEFLGNYFIKARDLMVRKQHVLFAA